MLFEKHGYPGTREHLESHDELVKKVMVMKEEYDQGKAALTMDLMAFLMDWLQNHIMKTDRAYASFLKDKL